MSSINNVYDKLANGFNFQLDTSRVFHNKWEKLNFDEEHLSSSGVMFPMP